MIRKVFVLIESTPNGVRVVRVFTDISDAQAWQRKLTHLSGIEAKLLSIQESQTQPHSIPLKQAEAKKIIWQEWSKYRPSISANGNINGGDMFTFFCVLSSTMPELTKFRARGDPWQIIHCWLLEYERVHKTNSRKG